MNNKFLNNYNLIIYIFNFLINNKYNINNPSHSIISKIRCLSPCWKNIIENIYKFKILYNTNFNIYLNALILSHTYDSYVIKLQKLIITAFYKKKEDLLEWKCLKRKIRGKNLCTYCNMLLYPGDETCCYCNNRLIRSCIICTVFIKQPVNQIKIKCNQCINDLY